MEVPERFHISTEKSKEIYHHYPFLYTFPLEARTVMIFISLSLDNR